MRILWFNWRDIKHPESGGAEVLTHEEMRSFVQGRDVSALRNKSCDDPPTI